MTDKEEDIAHLLQSMIYHHQLTWGEPPRTLYLSQTDFDLLTVQLEKSEFLFPTSRPYKSSKVTHKFMGIPLHIILNH